MSRQQTWATKAQRAVEKQKKSDQKAKYKTLCMTGPSLLQQAGVVQALVFFQSRGEDASQYLDDLATVYGKKSGHSLIETAQEPDLADYLRLSRDLLEVSAWMRRFAQIELGGE